MALFLDPPLLRTLDAQPSWMNRSGRVDRSGCAELRTSEVWRFARFTTIAQPRRHGARNPNIVHGYREAASGMNISARFLARRQHNRRPQHLQGDLRTTKSNAMKGPNAVPIRRTAPTSNPNKGAPQTNMLGLWEGWSQHIRIERWRLHDRLAQHFLMCPSCKQKFRKLFMPMCTIEEARDADLAELWINQLDAHHCVKPSLMALRASLVNRYGLLFRAERRLVCRKCLGLKYGQLRST